MIPQTSRRAIAAILVCLPLVILTLAGCDEAPREASKPAAPVGLLDRVPANTPYVFASSTPFPPKLVDAFLTYMNLEFSRAAKRVQAAADATETEQGGELLLGVFSELEGKFSREGVASLGFRTDALSAVYGIGMLPAIRVQIGDPKLLNALLDRIEQHAGTAAARDSYEGREFRRIDIDNLVLVIGVTEEELVAALLPGSSYREYLPQLLGDERPPLSLASEGGLLRVREKYGFSGHAEGYVDIARVRDQVTGADADGRRVWAELGIALPEVEPACRPLINAGVNAMRRYIGGTREASEQRYVMGAVLETSPEVAARLQRISAPVPGLGTRQGKVVDMGLGLNLWELRNAIKAMLVQVLEVGQGCSMVEPDKIRGNILQLDLALNPVITSISGLHLVVDGAGPSPDGAMMSADASVVAAAEDPLGLFAMISLASPEIASLPVSVGGGPVTIPADLLPPGLPPLTVMLVERAMGLAVGSRTGEELPARVIEPAGAPPPLFTVSYDPEVLLRDFGGPLLAGITALQQQGQVEEAETLRDQLLSMEAHSRVFGRTSLVMSAAPEGLVADQVIELKP